MAKRKSEKELFEEELRESELSLPRFLVLNARWNDLSEEEKNEMIDKENLF